jgi:replicative DNA helicase
MSDQLAPPVPPNSERAEVATLGALMLDNSAWSKVQGLLEPGDFYQRKHQVLFAALSRILGEGHPADVVTVNNFLKSKGHDETVGGLSYLIFLAQDTPSSANIAAYAQIVRDKSVLRQLITVANTIRDLAFAHDTETKAAITQAETAIFDVSQRHLRGKKGFSRLRDVLRDVLSRVEENYGRPSTGVLGVSSGLSSLDALTSGFVGGNLIVLAARPAMGKTALAMNMAESAALSGLPVAVFSMEMQAHELGERLLSSASGVGLKSIRESWTIQDNDWPLLTTGIKRLGDAPLFIDDSAGLSVGSIRSRCMKLSTEIRDEFAGGLGMIVIDYLQLMGSDSDRGGNRNNEIEDMTRGLKKLAKEFDIPVLLLSQLNRELERRPNKRPIQSDLRDSGGIEQDADLVLFLYRDEVYHSDSVDKGIAELIIGKQRNGPLGTVRLAFDGHCTRFREMGNSN